MTSQYCHSNLYCDITLCLAIRSDLELRSILTLCEIEPRPPTLVSPGLNGIFIFHRNRNLRPSGTFQQSTTIPGESKELIFKNKLLVWLAFWPHLYSTPNLLGDTHGIEGYRDMFFFTFNTQFLQSAFSRSNGHIKALTIFTNTYAELCLNIETH